MDLLSPINGKRIVYTKNDHFAKTGSGQTWGKLKKSRVQPSYQGSQSTQRHADLKQKQKQKQKQEQKPPPFGGGVHVQNDDLPKEY